MSDFTIETTRLMLRPFTHEDVEALHRLWTDADVRKYLWDDQIISRETAEVVVASSIESFDQHGFGFWGASLKASPTLIGFCGLRHFTDDRGNEPEVEILYGIAPEHWHQGLATEAAAAVLRFGFLNACLTEIFAGADPPNAASIKVMERLGLTFARQTPINGLEAVYYAVQREKYLQQGGGSKAV